MATARLAVAGAFGGRPVAAMVILGVWILTSSLAVALSTAPRTCEQRGFTTCPNACCGHNTTTNESVCCLQANAVCCNRPELAEKSTRFFCCPSDLPVCDFSEGTCRPAGYRFLRDGLNENQLSRKDLSRAQRRKPRQPYRGQSFAHSSLVLNSHLRSNVENIGFSARSKLRECSEFTVEDLHRVQETIFQSRNSMLDDLYQTRSDNRRLSTKPNSTLGDHRDSWKREVDLSNFARRTASAREAEAVRAVMRDGRCHETVMWFVHHLSEEGRRRVLESVDAIPMLPRNKHFTNNGGEGNVSFLPNEALTRVHSSYMQQVGCGVCHQIRPSEVPTLAYNATECPMKEATERCMILHRLNCNDSSEFADQRCCEGLTCWPIFLPPSDVAFGRHTTRCDPTWKIKELQRSRLQTSEDNVAVIADKMDESSPKPSPNPPLFAASWSATGKYFNITEDPNSADAYGTSTFFFNEFGAGGHASLRVDFGPVCPFKQLWDAGLDANYKSSCSVIFRNSTVTYVYPSLNISCVYCERNPFRAWHRDMLCECQPTHRRATLDRLGGDKNVAADLWEYEWWWNIFLVFRNYRNVYFKPGRNIPLRFEEDLDTGYVDLYDYKTYASPGLHDTVFTAPMQGTERDYIAGFHKDTAECAGEDERDHVKPHHQPACIIFEPLPLRKAWYPIP